MIAVPGDNDIVLPWLEKHGANFVPPFTTLAIVEEEAPGELRAVIVYNDFTGPNIELSAVTDGVAPFPRRIYRAIFDYPFNQLNVHRVTVRTASANRAVRRFIRRLGFRPEGKLRGFYGTDDAVIYAMLRNECRWLDENA